MARKWDIHIIPASHMDYGWAASPGECLSYVTEVIRTAIDDITGDAPGLKFTIEYALFLRHFLDVYPGYLPVVKRLLKEGRIEVCSTMTGPIEHWLDGEMLIHQIVQAKRWARRVLDYDPVTVQHTDLPGHVIQIPQILRQAEIRNLAYSRYHAPVPLHRWRAPDGSEVTACCHYHEEYRPGDSWEGYGWGWTLFVNNDDPAKAENELPPALERRESIWPRGETALLMGCQSDLQPTEPAMLERLAAWNSAHTEAPIRVSTISEFFAAVRPENLPVFSGEAPYSFHSLPAIFLKYALPMRRADSAVTAAEKWSVFAWLAGLGSPQQARISRARDAMFLAQDHNTGGRRGEVNDLEREKDALVSLCEGEAILQEKAMSFLVHIDYPRLEEGVYPVAVFNSLSWERDDLVETYVEAPMTGVKSLRIRDARGAAVPAQVLSVDEKWGYSRINFVFVAPRVPAHGYTVFYVEPSAARETTASHLKAGRTSLNSEAFDVRLNRGGISRIRWEGRDLVPSQLERPFGAIYGLEDTQVNVEAAPWAIDENYTGKEWDAVVDSVEVVERGPVRATVRLHGGIHETRFHVDISIYERLSRVDLRYVLDYKPEMDTMTRATFPLNVPGGQATYESPYGTVRLDKDEMPNTFRGHGERWVQKWIDISNREFGVTLATRQSTHVVRNDGIEPTLARTALDCGTIFYYYDQEGRYTYEYALCPHEGSWKQAASHRAGWALNSPLYACNWTRCFPIKPLRRSLKLPETGKFLVVNGRNVVITAVAQSVDDLDSVIVRLVEYYGRAGAVTLTCVSPVLHAEEVNFLEGKVGDVVVDGNRVTLPVRKYGIHTLRLRIAT